MNQALTLDQYNNETSCATCHRPFPDGALFLDTVRRNINGRLVHIVCPRKPKRK